jgi:Helix-turn-helix domain
LVEFSIPLSKFEKCDLVIKLHKEGKTYREIAHIAHISPRDIKLILKKYEQQKRLENNKRRKGDNEETKKISLSSQAFQLFKEGKQLDEVKVLLDIPFKKADTFWEQYLKSIRMEDCYEFYEIWQNDLSTLLPITNFMKRNNVYGPDIVNVLRTANDINTLNQTYYNLKTEVKSLEQKRMYLLDYSRSSYSLQPLPLNKMNYNYYRY